MEDQEFIAQVKREQKEKEAVRQEELLEFKRQKMLGAALEDASKDTRNPLDLVARSQRTEENITLKMKKKRKKTTAA